VKEFGYQSSLHNVSVHPALTVNSSSAKGTAGGWLIVGVVFVASLVMCFVATRGLFLLALGGALGLVAFPALAFAICGAVSKALLKRPMGRLGSRVSFLGTWVLLAMPVAAKTISKETAGELGQRGFYGFVAFAVIWFVAIRPWRNRKYRSKPPESVDPEIEAWKAQRERRLGTPSDGQPKLHSLTHATTPASLFDIEIPEANLRHPGVYEIPHATPYAIVLANQHPDLRCDAKVWIDGKEVGTWRIELASRIRLERPVNDTGRFTFFRTDTPEARQAGLDPANPALGLIRVKFMPEVPRDSRLLASGSASLEGGGTGLSGRSDQSFQTASAIRRDEIAEAIREVRLVASPTIRPLRPII